MNYTEGLNQLERKVLDKEAVADIRNFIARLREFAEAEDQRTATLDKRNEELLAAKRTIISENQQPGTQDTKSSGLARKFVVTLNSGKTVEYNCDTYVILPNSRDPQMVEFRVVNRPENSYRAIAHAKWSEIAELHAAP